MKNITIILISSLFLSGCAAINFSSKYYNPPPSYHNDVESICAKLISNLKIHPGLKYNYKIKICSERETKTAGIPQVGVDKELPGDISYTIYIPEYFIRYVYEFYYNYRKVILASIVTHEIAHREFDLADTPPTAHYLTDKAAVNKLLPYTPATTTDFYNSLYVLHYYWKARKGVAGHAGNILLNAGSLASAAFGGPTYFGDLFATDVTTRIYKFRHDFPAYSKITFKRSK
ncbi:MAG: hypothetical protein NTW18_06275 [Candidatus Omnitrophica bacterium]|nr:hypothetical protein [Candidatus Omnitrophota bacterium]